MKLASSDLIDQEQGKALADEILESKVEKQITEDLELRVKTSRTLINPSNESDDPQKMSQGENKGLLLFF